MLLRAHPPLSPGAGTRRAAPYETAEFTTLAVTLISAAFRYLAVIATERLTSRDDGRNQCECGTPIHKVVGHRPEPDGGGGPNDRKRDGNSAGALGTGEKAKRLFALYIEGEF